MALLSFLDIKQDGRLSLRQLGVLVKEEKRENFELTVYTNRRPSPTNVQHRRTCSRKVPGVAILDKKKKRRKLDKMAATSSSQNHRNLSWNRYLFQG